jgi:Tfp pilus assembly protein PilP
MNPEHSKRLTELLANQRGCGMPAARDLAQTMDKIRKRERATIKPCEFCNVPHTNRLAENIGACLLIILFTAIALLA